LADVQDVLGVICCHQYLSVDGVYKLNDFHQTVYMELNMTTAVAAALPPNSTINKNEFCPDQSVYNTDQLKLYPPELVLNKGGFLDFLKIDTYMMSSTMYFVLANQWMYEGFTQIETRKKLLNGEYTDMPVKYLEETEDRAVVAMVKAIKSGWNHDPHQQRTARQISNALQETLKELDGGGWGGEGVFCVSLLPPNLMSKNDVHDTNDESDYWADVSRTKRQRRPTWAW
jgi:hypothetical protein